MLNAYGAKKCEQPLAPHVLPSQQPYSTPACRDRPVQASTGVESVSATWRVLISRNLDSSRSLGYNIVRRCGAVAQLGERYNRTVEARGSSPLSSIGSKSRAHSAAGSAPQWHCGGRGFESRWVHLIGSIPNHTPWPRSSSWPCCVSRQRDATC